MFRCSSVMLLCASLLINAHASEHKKDQLTSHSIVRSVASDGIAHLVACLTLIMTEKNGCAYDMIHSTTGYTCSADAQAYVHTTALCLTPILYELVYQALTSEIARSRIERINSWIVRLMLPYPLAHLFIHSAQA